MAFASLTVDGGYHRKARRPIRRLPAVHNEIIDRGGIGPPYPFSHCYVNKDSNNCRTLKKRKDILGLMCCNRFLESLMRKSFKKVKRNARTPSSALQEIAQRIQNDCEQV